MEEKVAVVGMGQMGAGMARRLGDAGYDVIGFDIDEALSAQLSEDGHAMAGSTSDAVAGRSVVLSSLPNPSAVAEAWLGDSGIVASAESGTVCIELSTIDPQTMADIGDAARARGLVPLDCPVSGGPNEALTGDLVLFVGAEPADIERAAPVLDVLGADRQHTGDIGTAKVVKIVNNMMSMGNVLVAAEAFSLGVAAGVEPQRLYDVLAAGGGRSHHFTKRFPNAIRGDFTPGFKMELGEKDLALAVDLGRAMNVPTPSASNTRELYAMALAEGFRGQDIVSLVAMYDRWAEVTS